MKKYITSVAISIFAVGLSVSGLLLLSDDEILIQSLESRTLEDSAVYNKIKLIRQEGREIWMMNQSHSGLTTAKWERLAIVIEGSKASFYQLGAGKLVWDESLLQNQTAYRVSCFMCHSNGPRAIRPDYDGQNTSLANKVKIFFWNLKIKSYGRIIENEKQKKLDATLKVPFRHRSALDNERLQVKTCQKCHNESSFFGRGQLARQNALTIEFMVKNSLMPPVGFHLSKGEKIQINEFIAGF